MTPAKLSVYMNTETHNKPVSEKCVTNYYFFKILERIKIEPKYYNIYIYKKKCFHFIHEDKLLS